MFVKKKKKIVLINISISAKQLIQMNDADWQLGMSNICWWLQLSGEETQKTTTPSFFSQINIQPQSFESGNKGQKRNPRKYITQVLSQ